MKRNFLASRFMFVIRTFLNWGTGFVDKHILACLCFLDRRVFVRVQI